MAIHDFSSQRLFVSAPLARDAEVELTQAQAHYLVNVLRMKAGASLLVFNGADGEWRATLSDVRKRSALLRMSEQVRPQTDGPTLGYMFAPLKRARLDYMVQKATELGVSKLSPVLTRRTNAERVNLERMQANVIEAAEQCGILRLPTIAPPISLEACLSQPWPEDHGIAFCDEAAEIRDPLAAIASMAQANVSVLIGPEGGFSDDERQMLMAHPATTAISLGPRIMRADTAAVAALALVNAVRGDWR